MEPSIQTENGAVYTNGAVYFSWSSGRKDNAPARPPQRAWARIGATSARASGAARSSAPGYEASVSICKSAPPHNLLFKSAPAHNLSSFLCKEIVIALPNNQRQHRTLHIQKDVPPYALC